jgi:TetR/AcrR family tetracycline transcriptional repressor
MPQRRTKSSRAAGAADRSRPQQPLSRERIVSEALALVDREGLDALSMRRLAAALGVDPMAIYYYVPNKAALQDAIVEAVNVEIEGPAEFHSLDLHDLVVMAGRLFRATLLRHPNAAPLVVSRPLASSIGMAPTEAMLAGLIRGGMTPAQGVASIDVFSTFVTGAVLRQVQFPTSPENDPHTRFRQVGETIDPAEMPSIARALAEGGLMDFDAEFEFGLEALAKGLARVTTSGQGR